MTENQSSYSAAPSLLDRVRSEFERRKFSAGLFMAFSDFVDEIGAIDSSIRSLEKLFTRFPRQLKTAAGKRANTLIVQAPGRTISLRPFYNRVERFLRSDQKRFDYPSCAPHATQAWPDYQDWLDELFKLDSAARREVRQQVQDYVLAMLPSQAFVADADSIQPPLFRLLLEEFDFTAPKHEPTGAAFQGMMFGFLRADNPHLQVEVDKVRTGSKRLQRIGDVDAWDGERLAISAEVKHLRIGLEDTDDYKPFAGEVTRRGALGIVVATAFDDGVRERLEDLGLRTLSPDDLIEIVELWDPAKQRIAVQSIVYHAAHIEKNSILIARLNAFLSSKTGAPMSGRIEEVDA